MKRILLVAPVQMRFELTQDDSLIRLPYARAKAFLVPLHIATIAALTPDEFSVELWDESTSGPVTDTDVTRYDLVGITGYTAHLPRAREIARHCKEHGVLTAIGGPGISTMPQRHYDNFDILFVGEAEHIWPQFLQDWKKGRPQKIYRQVAAVDLTLSPVPQWETLKEQLPFYLLGGVQTSRGCPFDCEFCDVSYLFGRKYRYKPIDSVLKELSELERRGVWKIIFCDDNFIGNRKYAKDLLKEIISLNRSFRKPLGFATELTIDVARDEELLDLLADANVVEIFIGIESPNKDSLKEANKPQNVKSDLVADIRKVQSRGIALRGSLIVGFDHDDTGIFDDHLKFVQEAHIVTPSVRVLMAPPGTQLWHRVRKEGRLLKTESEGRYFGNPGTTNLIPKGMTRTELHLGYLDLIERMYDWDNFSVRMKGFIGGVTRRPKVRMSAREWKRLIPFIYFVFAYLKPRERRQVLGILWYTMRRAPFMLPRLVGSISRQYGYANRPKLREAIQNLVRQEEAEGLKIEIDSEYLVVSDRFKQACEKMLAEMSTQVYDRLADKNRVEESLIEIFVKFHAENGGELDPLSGADRQRLIDLSDRTITRRNNTAGNGSPASQPPRDRVLADVPRIGDRIMNAVEQEVLIARARAAGKDAAAATAQVETQHDRAMEGIRIDSPMWD